MPLSGFCQFRSADSTIASARIHRESSMMPRAHTGPAEPREERPRVGRVPQAVEDVKRKGGVPQPAEPVVPVALAADMLRKRGSDGGADGAGCDVGQEE